MPWRKALFETNPYYAPEPVHYRQTASTSTCGVLLTDLFIDRTEADADVTCPLCADLRTSYLSNLGQPTEGETA